MADVDSQNLPVNQDMAFDARTMPLPVSEAPALSSEVIPPPPHAPTKHFVQDIEMQAPPSPAPSDEPVVQRTSSAQALAEPMPVHDAAASIPSPASPAGQHPDEPSALPSPSQTQDAPNGVDSAMAVDEDVERPAKRARTEDVASPPHILEQASAEPDVPPVPATSRPNPPTHTTLSPAQFKFAAGILRSLRKSKDAYAFNAPVDAVALGIPHYHVLIQRPMDFGTIETKFTASNPASKHDPSDTADRYYSLAEFNADVTLVFDNCLTFNGPDHIVSQSAKRLRALFERSAKNQPPPSAPTPVYKAPPVVPTSAPKKAPRRPSTSVPTIRRTDSASATEFVSARPKREIHPPPPKDNDYTEGPAKPRAPSGAPRRVPGGKRRKDDGTIDQLRFCSRIVADLYKKSNANFASFFWDPVDEKLVPNYYKIIKRPMDLSTLKRNLDQKVYNDANEFYDDFQLMISNCVRFNPVGTMVYIAGQDLAKAFHEKWRALPPLHTPPPSSDEEDYNEDVEPNTIQSLEAQLAGIRDTIESLKTKDKTAKRAKAAAQTATTSTSAYYSTPRPAPTPRTSNASSGARRPPPPKKSSKKSQNSVGPRQLDADATLTFEEKKQLSETIQNLESPELDEVIQIIHDGVPDLGDNTDEIEIEIDALPPAVLRALWNAVIKPKAPPPTAPSVSKPFKSGRNQAGTGGLKRKSMDEAAEAEKMRLLEQRIGMFDAAAAGMANGAVTTDALPTGGTSQATAPVGRADVDSTHSSDSESDSDSSDSD